MTQMDWPPEHDLHKNANLRRHCDLGWRMFSNGNPALDWN